MKILRWLVRIVILLLLLILVLNNMQKVQFNFYGIYTWDLPLVVLLFLAMIIGFLLGALTFVGKIVRLKIKISSLKKINSKEAI